MSRSKITQRTISVETDTGAVLFSLVQGEQIESTITLDFLTNVGGYEFEAVVMEALNVVGLDAVPVVARPGGVNTPLNVRVPPYTGAWNGASSYNKDDVTLYAGIYYKLISGVSRVNATIPSGDGLWEVYIPNKIYVQWPSTMASDWAVAPTPEVPVQGFFELSVREPSGVTFRRLWKVIRGMVEISYSPTYLV